MGTAAVTAAYAGEFASRDRSEEDLLVLTDDRRHGRHALGLPFREATVLEVGPDDEIPDISGDFTTLAIDRSRLDPDWLARAVRAAAPALRSDSWVVVVLGPDGTAGDPPPQLTPGTARLAEVQWHGLGTVRGQPCAILHRTAEAIAPAGSATEQVVAADLAVRLGYAGPGTAASDPVRRLLSRYLEERRQSEHALLRHLEATVQELAHERARRQRRPAALVRDLLQRSRPGRAVLRVLRWCRRVTRRSAGGRWARRRIR